MSQKNETQKGALQSGIGIVIGVAILFGIQQSMKRKVDERIAPAVQRADAQLKAGPPADWIMPADERAAGQVIAAMRSRGQDWSDIDQELANRGLFEAGKRYRMRVLAGEPELMRAVNK